MPSFLISLLRLCPSLAVTARRAVVGFIAASGLLLTNTMLAVAVDTTRLRDEFATRFGDGRSALFDRWLQVSNAARELREPAKLQRINDFINTNIAFEDDRSVWDQSDYWATPLETLGMGRGDCEDFAIIKYVSLRRAGIANDKLRLIYVKATLKTPDGPIQVAHMVLAYYATPGAEPLLLDNLEPRILPAAKRADLKPIFSFNSGGIFAGVSGQAKAAGDGIGRLSRWEDALARIRAEGFEPQ